MKKIINTPENYVVEMCNGLVSAYPDIKFIQDYKILIKKEINKDKVTLISGGGCGHEPAHGGFIGDGMLDVAVCGDVFASPSQIQIYKAIKESASEKGTLLIIKNYSGDMMNFKNAAQLAIEDGIAVDYVKVDDDIAVEDSLYTVGRRGVAGTVFVHKIAGAAAQMGKSIEEVKAIANKAIANVKSLGFAFSSCTVPAKGSKTFDLAEDEMEYGVGIHGEPGIAREKTQTADELAQRMVKSLVKELNIGENGEIAILVNGFGATPLSELYLFNHCVLKALQTYHINASRVFVGNYMTSIDMQGASLSILKLDEELKSYLAMASNTPAFQVTGKEKDTYYHELQVKTHTNATYTAETKQEARTIGNGEITLDNIIYMVDKMSEIIIKNEVYFCELDSFAGDGDFGMSVAKGFKEVKNRWSTLLENGSSIESFLHESSMVIMEYCGGASGPIWGSAFRAASKNAANKKTLTIKDFADMMQAAVAGIQQTGERAFGRGAVVGDKTLLVPYADALTECGSGQLSFKEAFIKASKASVLGAKSTEAIVARMGRASSVGERSLGYPDAGAHALAIIFTEITDSLL